MRKICFQRQILREQAGPSKEPERSYDNVERWRKNNNFNMFACKYVFVKF